MTPQRQLILDAVGELGHATPEQVCQQVRRFTPTVNVTTVYRALDLLEKLGLVRHAHLGHGPPTYSTREHQHIHLVCHRCDQVIEVGTAELSSVRASLLAKTGFDLDATHLALSGTCRTCREES